MAYNRIKMKITYYLHLLHIQYNYEFENLTLKIKKSTVGALHLCS